MIKPLINSRFRNITNQSKHKKQTIIKTRIYKKLSETTKAVLQYLNNVANLFIELDCSL